jgi:hypothetical protein
LKVCYREIKGKKRRQVSTDQRQTKERKHSQITCSRTFLIAQCGATLYAGTKKIVVPFQTLDCFGAPQFLQRFPHEWESCHLRMLMLRPR